MEEQPVGLAIVLFLAPFPGRRRRTLHNWPLFSYFLLLSDNNNDDYHCDDGDPNYLLAYSTSFQTNPLTRNISPHAAAAAAAPTATGSECTDD